ncbi:MAG: hypothetical protein IH851_06730 [Armatimonadetes bacterium]|nr:hypothetical protein [Armatimonadota bacterium]
MICFLDNDILLKLSACDLLAEFFHTFKFSTDDARVLPSAKYFIRKRENRLISMYGRAGWRRALDFCGEAAVVEVPDGTEYDLLVGCELIDQGEALLIAATKVSPDSVLATSDKNCLRALAADPALDQVCDRLKRKVICLERAVHNIIGATDFESLKQKIVPVRDCDTALKAAFGSGQRTDRKTATAVLNSYIDDLRSSTKNLLI